jgi:hypothetical protein
MSIFVSINSPEAAILLTDGASAGDDFRLEEIISKVSVAKSGPFAVTVRGDADHGARIVDALVAAADRLGVPAAIAGLADIVDDLHAEFGELPDEQQVHVLVSAWLPGQGGIRRFFATVPRGLRGDDGKRVVVPAWTVGSTDSEVFGDWPEPAEMIAAGIPGPGPTELMSSWIRRVGGEVLELLRRKPGMLDEEGRPVYVIGGFVECTVLTPYGGRTDRLRTWPDVLGKRIDPYRKPAGWAALAA